MAKRRPNEEVFLDNGTEVRLVADFGFLVSVNDTTGRDVSDLFAELANGATPATVIRDVLACAMTDQAGEAATSEAEYLITKYGLQECAYMARIMLTHAMIGDEKKHALARAEKLGQGVSLLLPSLSPAFWKVGLLWVVTLCSSTTLACTILWRFVMPT